jgi:hypothetical protein
MSIRQIKAVLLVPQTHAGMLLNGIPLHTVLEIPVDAWETLPDPATVVIPLQDPGALSVMIHHPETSNIGPGAPES